MKKNKVVIYVDGGCLMSVHATDGDTDVVLVDGDDLVEQGKNVDRLVQRETKGLKEVF